MPIRRPVIRNPGLKALSLVIAIVVWFVLSGERRERISERSYRIPLSIVNIPSRSMVASPLPPTVDVRVRGPFTALRQLEPEKLEVVVDLLNAPRGERVYRLTPEDVNVPQDVETISIVPQELRVLLDGIEEKALPVVPTLTGQPAAGERVVEVQVVPRTVRVVGPQSVLVPMDSVATDPISLVGRATSFSTPATVVAAVPGVRVRVGQIVTVIVRLGPVPTALPAPTPTPAPKSRTG
jgi:YbbR domain-containing protein